MYVRVPCNVLFIFAFCIYWGHTCRSALLMRFIIPIPWEDSFAISSHSSHSFAVWLPLACTPLAEKSFYTRLSGHLKTWRHAMLMRPNKAETAVHGCHSPGDMAVRIHNILVRSEESVCVPQCCLFLLLFIKTCPIDFI